LGKRKKEKREKNGEQEKKGNLGFFWGNLILLEWGFVGVGFAVFFWIIKKTPKKWVIYHQ
jgi:hypothetical protein